MIKFDELTSLLKCRPIIINGNYTGSVIILKIKMNKIHILYYASTSGFVNKTSYVRINLDLRLITFAKSAFFLTKFHMLLFCLFNVVRVDPMIPACIFKFFRFISQ